MVFPFCKDGTENQPDLKFYQNHFSLFKHPQRLLRYSTPYSFQNRRMKDKKVKQRATVDGSGCVMMLKEE